MKKFIIFILISINILLFSQGCVFFNERGISADYYSDCKHYYDSRGFYQENCDKNIVDYKDFVTKTGPNTYHVGF